MHVKCRSVKLAKGNTPKCGDPAGIYVECDEASVVVEVGTGAYPNTTHTYIRCSQTEALALAIALIERSERFRSLQVQGQEGKE